MREAYGVRVCAFSRSISCHEQGKQMITQSLQCSAAAGGQAAWTTACLYDHLPPIQMFTLMFDGLLWGAL